MQKKVLAIALAGLVVPALALASAPLLVRFDGHVVPMRETVQVTHSPSGTVSVRTWTWRGPDGAIQVSESRGADAHMPAWAVAQMRDLQMQMQQMRRMEAQMAQPLLGPPVPVVFSGPLLMPFPGLAPPLEVRLLQPMIVPEALLPAHIIIIAPPAPRAASPAPMPHHGMRT